MKRSSVNGGLKIKAGHMIVAMAVLFLFAIAHISSVGAARVLGEKSGNQHRADATVSGSIWDKLKRTSDDSHGDQDKSVKGLSHDDIDPRNY